MMLKEICTTEIACCAPELRVVDAALLMRQKHVGDLVVVNDPDDQTPIGIVTDRDIVVEVLGRGLDPHTVTVREIMRGPVVVASDSDDAAQALERMRAHGVRRMPIMAEGRKLAGIVTVDDLLKQLAADANAMVEIIAREQSHERRTRR